ncbi:MAG: aminotransferase class V-fold PLP-dependent enzyme [Bacteroidota bacterium]
MSQSNNDPFAFEAEEMRKIGYTVIDKIVEHYSTLEQKRVLNMKSDEELDPYFGEEIPEKGTDPIELIEHLDKYAFTSIMHTDHSRFFSFIPTRSNFIGVMGDTLAAGFNVFAGHWMAGSSAAKIESTCVDWLKEICGFPEKGGGIFTSGGSMANMMAIATARRVKLGAHNQRGTIYYSDQTHSSLAKGLRILGFGEDQMRQVKTDKSLKMDMGYMLDLLKKDKSEGLNPFCIVGNAGTTNAGVIDPLDGMAEIAKEYDLWFHIDGAYGAAAAVLDDYKEPLKGMDKADSLTLDPHKWWFQPFEIGCLLVKDDFHLEQTFSVNAEYLDDIKDYTVKEINYYDRGVQLTRSFRALKLYMSIKTFGLDAFKQGIQKGINMAEYTEKRLCKNSAWKIITPAQMGIINFQYAPEEISDEQANILSKKISDQIVEDGFAMVITTKIHGLTVLRMCPIHPGVTEKDIDITIEKMEKYGNQLTIVN